MSRARRMRIRTTERTLSLNERRPMLSRLLAATLLLLLAADLSAQQPYTLDVRVEAEDDGGPVASADVELTGRAQAVTNRLGVARFTGLPAGRHVFVVRAFGYAPVERALDIRSDTAVVVTLSIDAILMDSLEARAETFTLLAEVRGADTRRGVPDAEVRVGDNVMYTDGTGYFRMRRLPQHAPNSVEIRAMGYLPATVQLSASRDTAIRIDLQVDPVGQAMVERQLERLDAAVNGIPYSVRTLKRIDMLRFAAPTIADMLKVRGVRLRTVGCVIIDGRPRFHGMENNLPGEGMVNAGLVYLSHMMPEDVERIDIINRGAVLVVYTYAWVRRELPKRDRIRPVSTDLCL